jgi:hypothetical protein
MWQGQDHEMAIMGGSFALPMSTDDAFLWFTPEGERAWAPEWAPRYPGGSSDPVPGLVFEVGAHNEALIWVVADVNWGTAIEYTVVVPGDRAGTVSVQIEPSNGGSVVAVRYRMTPLSSHGHSYIQHLQDDFPAVLESWRASIVSAAAQASQGN